MHRDIDKLNNMASKIYIKGIRKFNEQKVTGKTLSLFGGNKGDVKILYHEPNGSEAASYTLMTEGESTQGVNIKHMIGGNIVVELPWLASEMDVNLFYAFLNAVKKVHRASRILDENDKGVMLTANDALAQWQQRRHNMEELFEKKENTVITGVKRDFHFNPEPYAMEENMVDDAFNDFIKLQWTDLDAFNAEEERRHISDDEELSTLRVVDNTNYVFIGACRYVGMMNGNTCKMIEFDKFCDMMSGHDEFRRMDAAQALLKVMDDEEWNALFDEADGITKDNFRKTFIMRWNTDISNYKMSEFEKAMNDFFEEGFYYEWSIWDHNKANIGDKFYMIRTGNGKKGVVMHGTIIGTPYPDEDWSGRGRKVYYIRLSLSHMIHPDKAPLLLTTDELSEKIPDFNWESGHSGEMMNDNQALRLQEIWHNYVEQVHQLSFEKMKEDDFFDVYKEKTWRKPETRQSHGDHIETIVDLNEFTANIIAKIIDWPLYDYSKIPVTSEDHDNEKREIIALRKGKDMGLMVLFVYNNRTRKLELTTGYPCHEGTKHQLTIEKVFEWKNGIEAVVWGKMDNITLVFFATDYYANKEKYVPGSKVTVELAASAYKIYESKKEIIIKGDEAEKVRKNLGIKAEYDENGNLEPVVLDCEKLVVYMYSDEYSPDDAISVSPIEDIEETSILGNEFIKATINLCHES